MVEKVNHTIGIIEDDQAVRESLEKFLMAEGFSVVSWTIAPDDVKLRNAGLDLIILDWNLPGKQGVDWLREIRAKGIDLPVLMVTARSDLVDRILGLELGASDYVLKPFEPRELLARIRVRLREQRNQPAEKSDESIRLRVEDSDLIIDVSTRKVRFNSQPVELAKMEFDLLCLLARNPGKVFARDEILNLVWGFENYPTTRTVDTHVIQLRQKLSPAMIETVRGVGYRLSSLDVNKDDERFAKS
jgi:DNA-binding response OmpR family regulator